ncbi:hypothetical protein BGZ79_009122 [Entomortierella chlamydospora]|nr:hypothetical protein BGZ79_009122 [Entomortierella chlamydospora]
MDRTTPFLTSSLELFNDLGTNPFLISKDAGFNNDNVSSGSTDCLDNSKSNLAATATSAHLDLFDINNLNNNSSLWDFIPSEDHIAAAAATGLDLTPELSPSMSLYSPAVNSVNSPYGFDSLGFDDFTHSPSLNWESSFEEPLGSEHIICGSSSFEFDFHANAPDMNMFDFQLFPDAASESTTLKKLSMAPSSTENELSTIKESPSEPQIDCPPTPACGSISPAAIGCISDSFSTAKSLGQDVQAPIEGVAPRKPVQSPTKPGFQPNKRRRRRRITTEEAARVIPEESLNDPDAKARYKCEQCDKTFSRPFNLRSHRSTHIGLKPYPCPHVNANGETCHWSFARRHDLARHIRSRHSKTNLYTCKTCGAQCTRTDAFKRHLAKNAACGEAASEDKNMDQVSHL